MFFFPAVIKKWKQQRKRMLQLLKQQEKLILVGDGRCYCPGYSAKYCTYTFMEANSGNVVDTVVVPITEVTNSNVIEKEGSKGLVFSFCLVLQINIIFMVFRYRSSHQSMKKGVYEISKNTFLTENLWDIASVVKNRNLHDGRFIKPNFYFTNSLIYQHKFTNTT